ncbi:MAG: ribbon-helix-helix domain-containing protein [Candidatus Woesearchaeota archaeon]|nr:ribbon-helix-helix domain-containing protein [Candidatus Woesearchaeota archaeon]
MDVVSVKLGATTLQQVDNCLEKHHFETRTDFLREAVRDKLRALEEENALRTLEKYFGAGKGKRITMKRHEEIREEVAQKYAKKFGISVE